MKNGEEEEEETAGVGNQRKIGLFQHHVLQRNKNNKVSGGEDNDRQ